MQIGNGGASRVFRGVLPTGKELKKYLPLEGQEITRMRREETEETSDWTRRRVQDAFLGRKSHCLNRGKREDENMLLWEWARQLTKLTPLHDLGRSLIASTPRLFNSLPCSCVTRDQFPTFSPLISFPVPTSDIPIKFRKQQNFSFPKDLVKISARCSVLGMWITSTSPLCTHVRTLW